MTQPGHPRSAQNKDSASPYSLINTVPRPFEIMSTDQQNRIQNQVKFRSNLKKNDWLTFTILKSITISAYTTEKSKGRYSRRLFKNAAAGKQIKNEIQNSLSEIYRINKKRGQLDIFLTNTIGRWFCWKF